MDIAKAKQWLKQALYLFLIFILSLIAPQMFLIKPETGRMLFFVFTGLLIAGFIFRRMALITKHSRVFTAILALTLGLSLYFARTTDNDLQSLRDKDSQAFLQKLEASGDREKWLIELRTLDPKRYEIEQQKKSEDDKTARATGISGALQMIKDFKAETYTDNPEKLKFGVVTLLAFASIAEQRKDEILDEAVAADLKTLREKLIQLQKKTFPIFRKAYAKQASMLGWESNLEVFTSGKNDESLTLVAATFASNANIAKIHDIMRDMATQLRFKRINYKWFSRASEWQYMDLKTPNDDELIVQSK